MRTDVGQSLRSVTDTTAVIVVRAAEGDVDLTCGGVAMVGAKDDAEAAAADPAFTSGTLLGKRYEDVDATLELLCVKGGTSSLALGGRPLVVKAAKPLPASD